MREVTGVRTDPGADIRVLKLPDPERSRALVRIRWADDLTVHTRRNMVPVKLSNNFVEA